MKIFSKENLPMGKWNTYQKKRDTLAIRMNGPFQTKTLEGTLTCDDGYLALDSDNNPYPIAKKEFNKIYSIVRD